MAENFFFFFFHVRCIASVCELKNLEINKDKEVTSTAINKGTKQRRVLTNFQDTSQKHEKNSQTLGPEYSTYKQISRTYSHTNKINHSRVIEGIV